MAFLDAVGMALTIPVPVTGLYGATLTVLTQDSVAVTEVHAAAGLLLAATAAAAEELAQDWLGLLVARASVTVLLPTELRVSVRVRVVGVEMV